MCQNEVVADLKQRRPSVESISRIGTDTSKHIFQLHGVNVAEQLVQQRPWRKRCRADGRRPEAHARKDSSDSPVPVGMSTKAVSIMAIFLGRHPSDDQISRLRLPLWTATLKSECPVKGQRLIARDSGLFLKDDHVSICASDARRPADQMFPTMTQTDIDRLHRFGESKFLKRENAS
jgi:hypothetical protein